MTVSQKYSVIGVLCLIAVGALLFFYWGDEEPEVVIEPAPEVIEAPVPTYAVIGSSVEGRVIESYTYNPHTADEEGGTHLLFVGGIHGGYEWNSVLLSYELMDYLDANPDAIPHSVMVTVIPSLNPDGVYEIIGKTGRFTATDAPTSREAAVPGRFNANDVDLNRNFDCKWQPESTWRGNVVSAGTEAFSEPEAQALRSFVESHALDAAVFFHSQADAVYASECEEGILPETLDILAAYAEASGYTPVESFDAYPITGDVEGWLASVGVPALTVELRTYNTIEWEENLRGIEALFSYYSESASVE